MGVDRVDKVKGLSSKKGPIGRGYEYFFKGGGAGRISGGNFLKLILSC